MRLRRTGAVLVLTGAAIFGTAAAAAAADYPPTTATDGTVVTQAPPTTHAPAGASTGLPFTGSDSTELFLIGVAIAGAGTLVLVRMNRGDRPGPRDS